MALVIKDRVLETSTSTGTGDFTLGGALLGYAAFSSVCAVNDVCYYMIEAIDANGAPTGDWETGLGTYSAANTLTRTAVTDSSNSGSAVSFSAGNKRVSMSAVAATLKHRGALVAKAADQTGANYSTASAVVTWDSEIYDTDGFHDSVTNNSRLTVPNGVSKVRLLTQTSFLLVTASSTIIILQIQKNGSLVFGGVPMSRDSVANTDPQVQTASPVLPVVPGDYFEVLLTVAGDTSVTLTSANSWFAVEVVE